MDQNFWFNPAAFKQAGARAPSAMPAATRMPALAVVPELGHRAVQERASGRRKAHPAPARGLQLHQPPEPGRSQRRQWRCHHRPGQRRLRAHPHQDQRAQRAAGGEVQFLVVASRRAAAQRRDAISRADRLGARGPPRVSRAVRFRASISTSPRRGPSRTRGSAPGRRVRIPPWHRCAGPGPGSTASRARSPIAGAAGEADALLHEALPHSAAAGRRLHQEQAELGHRLRLRDQEDRSHPLPVQIRDPRALALGIVMGHELHDDLRHQGLEPLAPSPLPVVRPRRGGGSPTPCPRGAGRGCGRSGGPARRRRVRPARLRSCAWRTRGGLAGAGESGAMSPRTSSADPASSFANTSRPRGVSRSRLCRPSVFEGRRARRPRRAKAERMRLK